MSKSILDLEDDGDNVLFGGEDEQPVKPVIGKKVASSIKSETTIKEIEVSSTSSKILEVAETVAGMLSQGFDVYVEGDKLVIKEVPLENLEESELLTEDKIDILFHTSRRLMQELEELRNHILTIEQKVTQKCPIMNLLSNMKNFLLGNSNGRV